MLQNKRAHQSDFMQIIGLILIVPVLIAFLVAIINIVKQDNCSEYQKQIDSLDIKVSDLENRLTQTTELANQWEEKYKNLTNTNITKQDFIEIKSELFIVNQQINITNNQLLNLRQDIINITHIKNYYILLSFVITFSFTLFSLVIIDFFLLKMKFSKYIYQKLYYLRNKVEYKFDKKEE